MTSSIMNDFEFKQVAEWHDNGQKKCEGSTRDAQRDGIWTTWYENGQKSREVNYLNGVPTGSWTTWYETGEIKRIGSFDQKGRKDGLWAWYDKDGHERARADYRGEPFLN
mgnify:FL=1